MHEKMTHTDGERHAILLQCCLVALGSHVSYNAVNLNREISLFTDALLHCTVLCNVDVLINYII